MLKALLIILHLLRYFVYVFLQLKWQQVNPGKYGYTYSTTFGNLPYTGLPRSQCLIKDMKNHFWPSSLVVLDMPMLGLVLWLTKEQNIVVGRGFGQSNALGSLIKNEIGNGSLFLFFATFESLQEGWTAHYIYGWLKVSEIILEHSHVAQYEDEYGLSDHPHITMDAFRRAGRKPRNAIFLPNTWLFEEMKIPGCGYLLQKAYACRKTLTSIRKPRNYQLFSSKTSLRYIRRRGSRPKWTLDGRHGYWTRSRVEES